MLLQAKEIKTGDILIAGDLVCIEAGTRCITHYDKDEGLHYVPCECGRHYLLEELSEFTKEIYYEKVA